MINEIKIKLKNFLSKKIKFIDGFFIYIFGIFVFFFFGLLYSLFDYLILKDISVFGSMSFLILGFFVDFYIAIKNAQNNIFLKIILFVLFSSYLYFSFYISESIAKNLIFEIVNENPDLFQTAISILTGLYLIPSFSILFFQFIETYTSMFFILFVALLYVLFLAKRFPKIFRGVSHLTLFMLGMGIVFFGLANTPIDVIYKRVLGENFIENIIVRSSYYPNKICKNIKDNYIKILDNNNVSIVNLTKEDLSNINKRDYKHKIVFETRICERK